MIVNTATLDLVYRGWQAKFNDAYIAAPSHFADVAMVVNSTTTEENYAWLGSFPQLREWIGPRQIKNLSAHGFKIVNRVFESAISIPRVRIEDDQIGIFTPALTEIGRVTAQHPDELIFGLLANGLTSTCYDGQSFFDTDHPVFNADGTVGLTSNMQEGAGPAWFLLDTSRGVRPMIWQQRLAPEFVAVTRSEDEGVFLNDEYRYGVRARANALFGLWQLAFASKAALNATNYAAARAAMASVTADGGRKLGITPTHLVVPPELESDALHLLNTEIKDGGGSNPWKGTAKLIITPFL